MNGFRRVRVLLARPATAVLVAAALLLVAGCGPAPGTAEAPADPCSGEAARTADGQCVGLSSGELNFTGDPAFADVLGRIGAENARIDAAGGPPPVAVVYALPLPRVPDRLSTELRSELMGAHLLQLRANNDTDLGGSPPIRLLVANFGEGAGSWTDVVRRIEELTDPGRPGNVVAVAGLGQSLVTVRDAMAAMARSRIPMVPARLTASTVSPAPGTDGVFRIAPPNSAQVATAARYLTDACRPMLVQDINPDDLYTRDITRSFPQLVDAAGRDGGCGADAPLVSERFDSSLPQVETSFRQMMASVCIQTPDTVYFGGRGAQLPAFVRALGSRPCPGPVTVVTGDDGLGLAAAVRQERESGAQPDLTGALDGGVRVVVTALAHPGSWAEDPDRFPAAATRVLTEDCATCAGRLFAPVSLDDGDVIMGHDAMLVIVTALRGGVSQSDPTATTGSVVQGLLRIGKVRPVAGASGPIAFDPSGAPVTKNVPIVEITSQGAIRLLPVD